MPVHLLLLVLLFHNPWTSRTRMYGAILWSGTHNTQSHQPRSLQGCLTLVNESRWDPPATTRCPSLAGLNRIYFLFDTGSIHTKIKSTQWGFFGPETHSNPNARPSEQWSEVRKKSSRQNNESHITFGIPFETGHDNSNHRTPGCGGKQPWSIWILRKTSLNASTSFPPLTADVDLDENPETWPSVGPVHVSPCTSLDGGRLKVRLALCTTESSCEWSKEPPSCNDRTRSRRRVTSSLRASTSCCRCCLAIAVGFILRWITWVLTGS